MPKTTKTQAKSAIDSFFYSLDWVTGGTREETLRQAPVAVLSLEAKAAAVAVLFANPSKLLLADAHLMERAAVIPARLATYKERYCTEAATLSAAFMAEAREAGDPIHPTQQARVCDAMAEALATPSNVIQFPG